MAKRSNFNTWDNQGPKDMNNANKGNSRPQEGRGKGPGNSGSSAKEKVEKSKDGPRRGIWGALTNTKK